ncbi:50S ribosomal protein L25 [Clostridium sp. KNHs214]|uniref:50S ribosomal protein L25 n=1 Tax=Clostridium sp. KNHs214 TaxID=1540257 RepID=UPI000557478E|nr:50S ribosomal protein L25 [Clostridium sp. KNHs214]
MESLVLSKRQNKTSNSAKKKRRMGLVPGVLYGKTLGNYMFEVGELELKREINGVGEHGIIDLDVEGSKVKALIKEVQRDAVNHEIIHVDLQEVKKNSIVQSDVPIVFHNEKLVFKNGGILQKEKNSIKVQCNAEELPKSIHIDLKGLKVGNVVRMGDVEMAKEISMIEDPDTVILSVTYAKNEEINMENEENYELEVKEE